MTDKFDFYIAVAVLTLIAIIGAVDYVIFCYVAC